MFSNNKDTQKSNTINKANLTPSLISADVRIQGSLISQGEVQLDGQIDGDIRAEQLVIGQHGKVIGSIEATEVVIHGKVEGAIKANKIAVEASAHISGDVFHDTLSIAAGAEVEGQIKRLSQQETLSIVKESEEQESANA